MEMKLFGKAYQLPLWLEKTLNVLKAIGRVLASIGKWIFRLRGLFMAIPVVLAALHLATQNMARLPDEVGINLLANGQYEYLVSRGLAVMGPLVITAVADRGEAGHKVYPCIFKSLNNGITQQGLRSAVGIVVAGAAQMNVGIDKAGHYKAVGQVDDLVILRQLFGTGYNIGDLLSVDENKHILLNCSVV